MKKVLSPDGQFVEILLLFNKKHQTETGATGKLGIGVSWIALLEKIAGLESL